MGNSAPFSVQIAVRSYELDALGHVNHAVYHQYGELARVGLLTLAGGDWDTLVGRRTAPVLLETRVSYWRELRSGDVVDASCDTVFTDGATFTMDTDITKTDGTLVAQIACTMGLMNLDRRRLVEDPRAEFATAGVDLSILSSAT